MSQNKILIYLKRTVLRVAHESRTVTEVITDAVGTVIENLQRLSNSTRVPADEFTASDNLAYTRTLSATSATAFPEAEGYGGQATAA